MTTKTFTLTYEQVDRIIIEELQDTYDRWLNLEKDGEGILMEPEWETLEAIDTVLSLFMPIAEYQRWSREAALKKLTLTSELLGGYDL